MAIRNIKHGGLRRLFERGDSSRLHPDHTNRLRRILVALDSAKPLQALSLPSYRLHPLSGNREGFWSVLVSRNWRVVFRAAGADVFDVDLTDYHQGES